MTTTEYHYCPRCDARREMVMTSAGVLACSRCDNIDTFKDERVYKNMKEAR